jgi:hypothetical protein
VRRSQAPKSRTAGICCENFEAKIHRRKCIRNAAVPYAPRR